MALDDIRYLLAPSDAWTWPKDDERLLGSFILTLGANSDFPELQIGGVVILGVNESRGNPSNPSCSLAAHEIRSWLGNLRVPEGCRAILDAGDIRQGDTIEDTYYAVRMALAEFIRAGQTVIVIGGSHDLTHACYMAYAELEQVTNVAVVDPLFDLGDSEQPLDSANFLSRMVLEQPNHLFNLSHIGHQSYHVSTSEVDLMKKLYFEAIRLGDVQADLEELEPTVRNADIVSIDLASIRYSDLPGNYRVSSNGFYGEEACRICRYAGLSDKVTVLGLFELTTEMDFRGQSAHLVAQMIWYFMQGHASRVGDTPIREDTSLNRYTVAMQDGEYPTVFYKSLVSDRWWMEVPYPSRKDSRYSRHVVVPCSYRDYKSACDDEIPDRWWQTYQKLI
jgi:formiminoglutamase